MTNAPHRFRPQILRHSGRATLATRTRTLLSCVSVFVVLAIAITAEPGFAVGATGASSRHAVAAPGRPTHLTATRRHQEVILVWHAPAVTTTTGAPTDYLVIWTAPPIMPLAGEADTHSIATRYVSKFGAGSYQVEAENAKGTGPPSNSVTVPGSS
jgi:hypothetical protein